MSKIPMSIPRSLSIGLEATIPVRGGREIVHELCRVALIALPILVSGTAAMAVEDIKIYTGAMCQPQISTDRVTRDINGKMFNSNGNTRMWICPVVRQGQNADGVEFAAISVLGTSPTFFPACTFRSMTSDGRLVESPGSVVASDPNNPNLKRFQFGVGDGNIRNAFKGYYLFQCSMPNGHGVVTYEVDDNEGEG